VDDVCSGCGTAWIMYAESMGWGWGTGAWVQPVSLARHSFQRVLTKVQPSRDECHSCQKWDRIVVKVNK